MHARDLDVPDSESVYFFLLNSCSARAKLYVYFVRVQAISKSCRCTKKVRRAMHEANNAIINGSQKLPVRAYHAQNQKDVRAMHENSKAEINSKRTVLLHTK